MFAKGLDLGKYLQMEIAPPEGSQVNKEKPAEEEKK